MPLPLVSHLLTNLWILCNIHGSEVAKLIESRGKHRERESVGEAFLQVLQFTQWHLVLLRNKSLLARMGGNGLFCPLSKACQLLQHFGELVITLKISIDIPLCNKKIF